MKTFLNANVGMFSLIFSAIVATSTVVYALLTWRLVEETRLLRKAQTEPKLSIFIQPREYELPYIDLVVENIGFGPARNIKFKVEPDFELKMLRKKISELNLLKNGLQYLAPKQKLQFLIMIPHSGEELGTSFTVHASYQDDLGNDKNETFEIKVSEFNDLLIGKQNPLKQIAAAIEKLSGKLR